MSITSFSQFNWVEVSTVMNSYLSGAPTSPCCDSHSSNLGCKTTGLLVGFEISTLTLLASPQLLSKDGVTSTPSGRTVFSLECTMAFRMHGAGPLAKPDTVCTVFPGICVVFYQAKDSLGACNCTFSCTKTLEDQLPWSRLSHLLREQRPVSRNTCNTFMPNNSGSRLLYSVPVTTKRITGLLLFRPVSDTPTSAITYA